jgi:adenosylhomocysteine/aminodeoxyfutalosine nucleosidase
MKIGILGAMQEEIKPLLEVFKDYEEIKYANNTYYKASYKSYELIIAYSKIGKVFSTMTACAMIEKFGCEKIFFSGVAGGINKNLKIGDLIVANKLCQHDLDITAFGHPMGYVPEGKVYVETDIALKELSQEVAKEMGIVLQEGIIATGDQFVSSNDIKDKIVLNFKADALEMEGASVAIVCDAYNVPYLILRSISDTADGKASVDFDKFLDNSAKQSANFIIKILDKLVL